MTDLEKIDWFKLLILLIPVGGGLYSSYNFLQHNVINNYFYINTYKGITIAILLMILMLLYILFKCLAKIFQNIESYLNNLALVFINLSILSFSILLIFIYITIIFFYFKIPNNSVNLENIIYIMLVSIVIILLFVIVSVLIIRFNLDELFGIYFTEESVVEFTYDSFGFLFRIFFLIAVASYIWLIPISSIIFIPLPGEVIIENESSFNDSTVNFFIQITGPNTGLSIILLEENSNNLHDKAIIHNIEPEYTLKTFSNGSLFVNPLGNGKYRVRVNTTDFNRGYYQLKCEVPHYEYKYNVDDFIV